MYTACNERATGCVASQPKDALNLSMRNHAPGANIPPALLQRFKRLV